MPDDPIRTVLVTGATGFIGAHLCQRLAASGYAVRILCRETSNLAPLKGIIYSKYIADLSATASLERSVEGVDYVVHLAGLIKASREAEYMRVNRQGTVNLLNAVKNCNTDIRKFVLVSSAAAGGPSEGWPRREDDPPRPVTPYGRSKLAGEEAAAPFQSLFPITIVRPPAVYGPADRETMVFFTIVNRGLRPYLGGGGNRIQVIHVEDLISGIKLAMESDRSIGQVYNLAEARSYSARELFDLIGARIGRKSLGVNFPRPLLLGLAFLSEIGCRLLGRVPMFSRAKVMELVGDWELDVSKAREHLGFEARIDFATGAAQTIEWYRRQGWIR